MNRASSERAKKIVPNPCCTASLNRIEGVPRYSSTPIAAVLGPKSLRPKEYTQAGMGGGRGAGSIPRDSKYGGKGGIKKEDSRKNFSDGMKGEALREAVPPPPAPKT